MTIGTILIFLSGAAIGVIGFIAYLVISGQSKNV